MSGSETASVQRQQKKVLVIEDDELNRRLLEVRLEIEGLLTLATNRAETALAIAREQRPDLILMDIQLPGISGLEGIRRLKSDEETRAIPVIAVTAFSTSPDECHILASGCDGYLGKPFRGDELIELVRKYLR